MATRTYECLNCGTSCNWGHSKVNKYCGIECQSAYKWRAEIVPKIESGKATNPEQLKRYLFESKGHCCSECGQGPIWNDKPLTLQLDHIDGDSDNNAVSNLRILCPNCHTQTATYGSKGRGSRYKKDTRRNKYLQGYKTRACSSEVEQGPYKTQVGIA